MDNTKAKYLSMHWYLFAIALVALFFQSCSQARQLSSESSIEPAKQAAPRYHSNFDFTAGDKLLWQESFATNIIGDFPKGWNTNAAGEIVQSSNGGHALLLNKDGVYIPTTVNLPKNFTLEFTLSCSANYSYYSSPLQIMFAGLAAKKEFAALKQYNPHNKDVVKLTLHPTNAASKEGFSTIELIEKGIKQSSNEINSSEFFAVGSSATVKVAIWRQDGRLRVYLNKEKIWDLPQAFSAGVDYNSLVFGIAHLTDKTGKYYLSDFKLATDAGLDKQTKNTK